MFQLPTDNNGRHNTIYHLYEITTLQQVNL